MASSGPVVRTLAGFAALVLLTAACGGGGSKKAASTASSTTSAGDTTTSVADTNSTAAPGAAGATGTTKAGAATATTKAGAKVNGQAAANYTPPAGSTAATPAKPGTYKYDTSGTSTFGAQSSSPPSVTPLIVDPPAGTRQHATHDNRKADGSGSVGETTLDYLPAGVFLVELKITTKASGITDVQDFVANPPVNIAPTGVKPGQSVEFDISGSGTNVHVKIDFVRTERLTIGGQAVDTLVIHQTGTLSGKVTGTQTSDSWVSPQSSLTVKDHTIADVTAYGIKGHSDITTTLQKVTPG